MTVSLFAKVEIGRTTVLGLNKKKKTPILEFLLSSIHSPLEILHRKLKYYFLSTCR